MLVILTGLVINHINERLDAAGATIRENNAILDSIDEDNTTFDRNIEKLSHREEMSSWPPADTLYVDMALKPGVVGMTMMAYNDTMNALLLLREDDSVDTMFFMGNTAPTVIDAPISTATFGGISAMFPDPNINLEYVEIPPNTEEWFALKDDRVARVYSTPLWTYIVYYNWWGTQTIVNDTYRPLTREQMKTLLLGELEENIMANTTTANSEAKYRLHWRAVKTDATGQGTSLFPYAEARQICDELNRQNQGWTTHWIEIEE